MGRPPPRPRRAHLPLHPGPQRPRPGRLRQGPLSGGGRRGGLAGSQRGRGRDRGAGRAARRGPTQQGAPDRRGRGRGEESRVPGALRDAAVRRRGPDQRHRGAAPRVPVPRPAAPGDAQELRAARRDRLPRAEGPARPRIPRGRDSDADPLDPRGRPRLPGPVARAPRAVVRAAAVAPALQADPDDVGLREVLSARPLLPGRGPARRPAVRVHADRPRDVLSDARRTSTTPSRPSSSRPSPRRGSRRRGRSGG